MPSYKRAFPSRFFKADDMNGEQLSLTIKQVQFEEIGFGNESKEKLVAYFVEDERGLPLNRTNADTLAELSGADDEQGWAGLRVELCVEKVAFQGKKVPALRLRGAPPVKEDDKDLPF